MTVIIRTTETVLMKLEARFEVPNALEWMDCSFSSLILRELSFKMISLLVRHFNKPVRLTYASVFYWTS